MVLTPLILGGSLALNAIDTRVSERIVADLTNIRDLETSRINSALASLVESAALLASDSDLVAYLDPDVESAPGRDENQAEELLSFTSDAGARVRAIRIVTRDGSEVARSGTAAWQPSTDLVDYAMDIRRPMLGDAFEASPGDERLGTLAPVVTPDGSVVGALLVEYRLSSVTQLVYLNERYGDTAEVLLVQRGSAGALELITRPRFARDAAFSTSHQIAADSAVAQSITSAGPTIVRTTDYRSVETIAAISRIEDAGWGVVVKMDVEEAFALRSQVERYARIVLAAVLAVILIGWLLLVRPLGRRLRRAAEAVDRVVNGDESVEVADHGSDEIGHLTRSIDGLAADLAHDRLVREKTEERLRWRTEHDILTGLVNRSYAMNLIEGYSQQGTRYGVLFLDLDGFKQVNDTHGHLVGDEVLQLVSRRLQAAAGPDATVARWGGDEFLIVVDGEHVDGIGQTRLALGNALSTETVTTAGTHHIGASIGIATSDDDATPAAVLHRADTAMFRSKHTRTSYRKVSPATIRLVESALADDRIEAFLQPVVTTRGDSVYLHGAEALVRLRASDGTLTMPNDFLDELGTTALASALDLRVLSLSLAAVGQWLAGGMLKGPFTLGVNFGIASMSSPDIAKRVAHLLQVHNVPPSCLQIEIPETVEEPSQQLLAALRGMGLELAIDDVGCQYSNLARLVDVNANVAKIDRRWIPVNGGDTQQHELLAGLVDQCQMLGFRVIAEGIETADQLDMLSAMGVHTFQGYFFGRPQPIPQVEASWLGQAPPQRLSDFGKPGETDSRPGLALPTTSASATGLT